MRNRRSRRLAAVAAVAAVAAGALTLMGAAGAVAAPIGHQPHSGLSPLCVVMPQTQGCQNGPIQK